MESPQLLSQLDLTQEAFHVHICHSVTRNDRNFCCNRIREGHKPQPPKIRVRAIVLVEVPEVCEGSNDDKDSDAEHSKVLHVDSVSNVGSKGVENGSEADHPGRLVPQVQHRRDTRVLVCDRGGAEGFHGHAADQAKHGLDHHGCMVVRQDGLGNQDCCSWKPEALFLPGAAVLVTLRRQGDMDHQLHGKQREERVRLHRWELIHPCVVGSLQAFRRELQGAVHRQQFVQSRSDRGFGDLHRNQVRKSTTTPAADGMRSSMLHCMQYCTRMQCFRPDDERGRLRKRTIPAHLLLYPLAVVQNKQSSDNRWKQAHEEC